MKVFFLNPPFLPRFSREQRSPAVTKSGTIYYPMWLSYAAGTLEDAGYDIDLADGVTLNWTRVDVERYAEEKRPDMTVLLTSTPSIANDLEIATLIRKKLPDSAIVLVGPHVSALPEETLESCPAADAVAYREYEYTIREYAECLKNGSDVSGVKGIVYRDGERIVRNRPRPFIEDLDELPFVSRVYRDYLNYKDYFYSITQWPEVTIITGRGCPHRCKYCVYPQTQNGHAYRWRGIDEVVKEFAFIRENFSEVKEIFIEDDTLTANPERCREICQALIKQGNSLRWTANSRADVDYETLRWMRKAGCRLLCVGFESGNQGILDDMGKSNTLENARNFVKAAKSAGVMVHGCFMVGNPGETEETMVQTLEFAKKLNTDTAQFFPIMVYPGTQSYDHYKEKGYVTAGSFREWLTRDGLHNCVVDLPGLDSRSMVEFCDRARREYYLRPRYLLFKLKQTALHPTEAQRTLKSFKIFYRYLFRGSFIENHKRS